MCSMSVLGVTAPGLGQLPCLRLVTLGLVHLCTWFHFFSLPWGFRCGFGFAFAFLADYLPRVSTEALGTTKPRRDDEWVSVP